MEFYCELASSYNFYCVLVYCEWSRARVTQQLNALNFYLSLFDKRCKDIFLMYQTNPNVPFLDHYVCKFGFVVDSCYRHQWVYTCSWFKMFAYTPGYTEQL